MCYQIVKQIYLRIRIRLQISFTPEYTIPLLPIIEECVYFFDKQKNFPLKPNS